MTTHESAPDPTAGEHVITNGTYGWECSCGFQSSYSAPWSTKQEDHLAAVVPATPAADDASGLCHEFIDTGRCGHTDAEHDAMVDASTEASEPLTEAERTYRPCAGCDAVGASCRATRCPATGITINPPWDDERYRSLVAYLRHSLPAGEAVADLDALIADREAAAATKARADERRAIRWRVETACDGYENLMDEDVPGGGWTDVASYQSGAADAARAIRGVL